MTPIQRDTLRKQATREQVQTSTPAAQPLDRSMRYKLGADRARLKKIASMQRKAEVKAELLPEYLPYLEGVMAGGGGDEILTQVMIWAFDAQQFECFAKLARYALDNGVAMPTEFARPLGSWLAESTAKAVLKWFDGQTHQTAVDNIQVLLELAQWLAIETQQMDMHDEIRAKLQRACGEIVNDAPTALEHFETALRLDPHIRVKKRIAALREQCAEPESPTSQGPAAAGATVDVTTTPPSPSQIDPSPAALEITA